MTDQDDPCLSKLYIVNMFSHNAYWSGSEYYQCAISFVLNNESYGIKVCAVKAIKYLSCLHGYA